MYLKRCLLEIKDRLRPTTRELGLRHTLGRGHCDDLCLFFDRRDANGLIWRSPVSFTFPPASETGEAEISWKNVKMGVLETVVVPVGNNGWVFYDNDINDKFGELIAPDGDAAMVDEAFHVAREQLTAQALSPVYPLGTVLPKIVSDPDVGEFWFWLGPECDRRGIADVEVVRNEDQTESYRFHFEGQDLEIAFRRRRVDLVRDEEMVRELGEVEDPLTVIEKLRRALDAMAYRSKPGEW